MSSPAPRLDRDRLTWLTYLMLGFLGCLLGGISPILPSLRRELNLSYAAAGLHASMFALGLIIVGTAGDRAIHQLGRRRLFWSAAVSAAIGAVVLALGTQLAVTLGGALLIGIAGSLLVVIVPAVLSDRHGRQRSTAIAEANSIASAAGALAPIIIGLAIFIGWSWRAGILIVPALFLPALLLLFRRVAFPRSSSTADEGRRSSLPRAYWRQWLTIVLVVSVEFGVGLWASEYMGSVVGLPVALAAAAPTVFLTGMVMGRAAGGRLVLRRAAPRMLQVSIGVAGAGFALFWVTRIPVVAMAGLFVTGLGTAMLYPLSLSLALDTAPDLPDTASARAAVASGVAILAAPLVLAGIADQIGLRLAYLVVVAFLAAALASQRFGRDRASSGSTVRLETMPGTVPQPAVPDPAGPRRDR